ncbi:nucleotide exchange factor GrpE, partial [Salmonella enterica subsp. enterica serovar Virginia]|nr:nucleotide exchange factor GrpE [Salmonella enterica subsp. enterica serovar Virginia]
VVRKFGVEVIAETNVPLDPNVHQAIAMVESEEVPAGNVLGIIQLLRDGKKVEIIVGDKTANDFYIPEDEPFKIIGALPYLYE